MPSEPAKTYIIWATEVGCVHEDISEYAQAFIKRIKQEK